MEENNEDDKNEESLSNDEETVLPKIENFFLLKGKVMLVDTDKIIYRIKKCKVYMEFVNDNKDKFKSKEDLFNAYLQSNTDNNSKENTSPTKKSKSNLKFHRGQ